MKIARESVFKDLPICCALIPTALTLSLSLSLSLPPSLPPSLSLSLSPAHKGFQRFEALEQSDLFSPSQAVEGLAPRQRFLFISILDKKVTRTCECLRPREQDRVVIGYALG